MSAKDLTGWYAFEKAYGPIDHSWTNELLAQVHELLQTLLYAYGGQYEDNPFPKPKPCKRAGELLQPPEKEDEEEDEEPPVLIPDEFFDEDGKLRY